MKRAAWVLIVLIFALCVAIVAGVIKLPNRDVERGGGPGEGSGATSVSRTPGDNSRWIASLSDGELGVLSRLATRAYRQEFTAADVDSYRWVGAHYKRRTGKQLSPEVDRRYVAVMHLVFEYNEELEKCLLTSYDSCRPTFSMKLRALQKRVVEERALSRRMVSSDSAWVHEVASHARWSTQSRQVVHPLSRSGIKDGLAGISRFGRNASYLDSALAVTPAK